MAETLTEDRGVDLEAQFDAFRGAAKIGSIALGFGMGEFGDRIGKGLDLLGLKPLDAPEGSLIEIMGCDSGFIYVERRTVYKSIVDGVQEHWYEEDTRSRQYELRAPFLPKRRNQYSEYDKQTFCGTRLEHDYYGQVWLYTEDGKFRARLHESHTLSLIDG